MTNAELLAKLLAKIDKLYGEYKDKFHQCGDQYHLGLIDGLDMAERVLNTLESEKPMNQEGLEEEIERYLHSLGVGYGGWVDGMEDEDLRGIARHFYDLGCRRTAEKYDELEYNRQRAEESPLPEDTVLFNKGVEEGKRLMMDEAVEIGTTEICWEQDGERAFPTFDPPVEDLLMPGIISQKYNDGDKVRVIIIKKED